MTTRVGVGKGGRVVIHRVDAKPIGSRQESAAAQVVGKGRRRLQVDQAVVVQTRIARHVDPVVIDQHVRRQSAGVELVDGLALLGSAHDRVLLRRGTPTPRVDGVDGQLREQLIVAADEVVVDPVERVAHGRIVGVGAEAEGALVVLVEPVVAAHRTGPRGRVLIIVVAGVGGSTGAVRGKGGVIDLDDATRSARGDGDPEVVAAAVRHAGVLGLGPVDVAQLMDISAPRRGWCVGIALAAAGGPALGPREVEPGLAKFAERRAHLAPRLAERDRRKVGRHRGPRDEVRSETEYLHEEDRGLLANGDAQLVGVARHGRRHDDHTVQGVRRIEAVAPGLVDGTITGVVARTGRNRLGAIELVGHEDNARQGPRRGGAFGRNAV